jgi:hypothetical protein
MSFCSSRKPGIRHDVARRRTRRAAAQPRKHDAADPLFDRALFAARSRNGLSTGWKQCGSLAVARTADRMVQLKRTAAVAQAFGVACDVITDRGGRALSDHGDRRP